jgi:hypothetical protein
MASGESNADAITDAMVGNQPTPSLSAAGAKKQKTSEEKARRDAHLL